MWNPVMVDRLDPYSSKLFLPDFCSVRTMFALMLVAELLGFVLVLWGVTSDVDVWNYLALVSLFVQGVALTSAAILCLGRGLLARFSNPVAGVASYLVVIGVTFLFSEIAHSLIAQRLISANILVSPVEGSWPSTADVARIPRKIVFVLRNVTISAIVTAIVLRYLYIQYQWRIRVESESRARIQALQSRIRPHFLFNSMNTIASLTRSDPQIAEQITEDLAELFRVSLSDASVPVPLGRELEVCRQYLRIEEQRLGDRMATLWTINDLPANALLPALSLQPLVENAVYHGVEPDPDGGRIEVSGEYSNGMVTLRVVNTVPVDPGLSARSGNQMAQDNVYQRLKAFFGEKADLNVKAGAREYTVSLTFPYLTEIP